MTPLVSLPVRRRFLLLYSPSGRPESCSLPDFSAGTVAPHRDLEVPPNLLGYRPLWGRPLGWIRNELPRTDVKHLLDVKQFCRFILNPVTHGEPLA